MAGYTTPAWTNDATPAIDASALTALGQAVETAEHPYGVCSTAAGTAAKTVTIDVSGTLELFAGLTVRVKFSNANTASAPTLNVNGTGAKALAAVGTESVENAWAAGDVVNCTYDGTSWVITSCLAAVAATEAELAGGMAILSDGDTHVAITQRQYVYVRNHSTLSDGLYKATANIAANGTLSTSNVAAVSGGGLNDIVSNLAKTKINTKQDGITASANTFTYTGVSVTIPAKSYYSLIGRAIFRSSTGSGAALSQSSTVVPGTDYRTLAYNEHGTAASLSGYTDSQLTLYLWGRWSSASTDHEAWLQGWYEPAE